MLGFVRGHVCCTVCIETRALDKMTPWHVRTYSKPGGKAFSCSYA